MNIVIVSRSKRHTRIYYYFKKAFENQGHAVLWLKYPKIQQYLGTRGATALSTAILARFKPDLLFLHGLDISFELMEKVSARLPAVIYFDDCLTHIDQQKFSRLIHLARQTETLYITNRGEIAQYRAQGVKARFLTGGCDAGAHYRVSDPPSMYHSEVAFIGKPSTPERVAFLQAVAARFDLKLWGGGWEKVGLTSQAANVYADEYRKICAGAKIILGWNVDDRIDLYFSNRTWYTLGCGGFLLTAYSPNLEVLFERGRTLDWFQTAEEGCEKIRYYLDHEAQREKIALAGYELAHSRYRYDDMVRQILANR